MCGDQIDKFRLPNNLPVCAQKPGIPFQALDVFFAKPPFDDHFLKRFVLKDHATIIFKSVNEETRCLIIKSTRTLIRCLTNKSTRKEVAAERRSVPRSSGGWQVKVLVFSLLHLVYG